VAYDAWIPNLQAYANFVAIGGSPYATSYPALVQNYLISSLCQAAQQNCVGANQQYASQAVCEAVLKTKNYGDYDEAWGDNVVCRTIHILLTKVRPEVCVNLYYVLSIVTMFATWWGLENAAVCIVWVNAMIADGCMHFITFKFLVITNELILTFRRLSGTLPARRPYRRRQMRGRGLQHPILR